MMTVRIRLIVLMTNKTGEISIACIIIVAIQTRIPQTVMPAGVNREILAVVKRVIRSLPSRIGSMALGANR